MCLRAVIMFRYSVCLKVRLSAALSAVSSRCTCDWSIHTHTYAHTALLIH